MVLSPPRSVKSRDTVPPIPHALRKARRVINARAISSRLIVIAIMVCSILLNSTILKGNELATDAVVETSIASEAKRHSGQVTALVFSPGGKYLASSGVDGHICLWDLEEDALAFNIPGHKEGVFALVFSPDGKTLVSAGADKMIRLWNARTGSEIGAIPGHTDKVACLAFSEDGKTLASAGYDKTIRLWNPSSRREIGKLNMDEGRITSIRFAQSGTNILSAGVCTLNIPVGGNFTRTSQADAIRLWNLKTEKEALSYPPRGSTLCVTSDETYALCAGSIVDVEGLANGTFAMNGFHLITLLDLPSGKIVHEIPFRGQALCLSPDGKIFASGQGSYLHSRDLGVIAPNGSTAKKTDTSLRAWELATAKEYLSLPEKQATVLAFSPRGILLAAGTAQGKIILYDLRKEVTAKQHSSMELKEPGQESLEVLWQQLANANPAEAYLAAYMLTYSPEQAVLFLKQRLTAVSKTETDRVNKLLRDLQQNDFSVRGKAFEDLKKVSWGIQPRLRRLLREAASPDFRRQIASLIAPFTKTEGSDDFLRQSRAIHVLEVIASKDAASVLRNLAEGEPLWRQTEEAQYAVARLKKRLENK